MSFRDLKATFYFAYFNIVLVSPELIINIKVYGQRLWPKISSEIPEIKRQTVVPRTKVNLSLPNHLPLFLTLKRKEYA